MRALLTLSHNMFKLLPEANRLVSSANKEKLNRLEIKGKSLIYIINRSGPNIEPCGTPQLMGKDCDNTLL